MKLINCILHRLTPCDAHNTKNISACEITKTCIKEVKASHEMICKSFFFFFLFLFFHQYIPLKTGFERHMLAPCSSYSAFVRHACTWNNKGFSVMQTMVRELINSQNQKYETGQCQHAPSHAKISRGNDHTSQCSLWTPYHISGNRRILENSKYAISYKIIWLPVQFQEYLVEPKGAGNLCAWWTWSQVLKEKMELWHLTMNMNLQIQAKNNNLKNI